MSMKNRIFADLRAVAQLRDPITFDPKLPWPSLVGLPVDGLMPIQQSIALAETARFLRLVHAHFSGADERLKWHASAINKLERLAAESPGTCLGALGASLVQQ